MELKDELAELEARRAAFNSMANDPCVTEQEREVWRQRLAEVTDVQACISADMLVDLAWRWSDDNLEIQRQVLKFRQ